MQVDLCRLPMSEHAGNAHHDPECMRVAHSLHGYSWWALYLLKGGSVCEHNTRRSSHDALACKLRRAGLRGARAACGVLGAAVDAVRFHHKAAVQPQVRNGHLSHLHKDLDSQHLLLLYSSDN